jgi:hypothetical protein
VSCNQGVDQDLERASFARRNSRIDVAEGGDVTPVGG